MQHRTSVTSQAEIAELLDRAWLCSGSPITRLALLISAHVFLRPGELRFGHWSEVDFKFQEWRIPAPRMKMKDDHIVPLSTQSIQLLKELRQYSGNGTLMFPSESKPSQPISENTLNQALRRLGYSKDMMTAHGFRGIASTTLNGQGWNRDAIERQLSHAPRDKVRAAYNDAQYLHERKLMMSEWSKWLESLSCNASLNS